VFDTTGHIAFYFINEKIVFTGDTLFALGCGRLFEGTPEMMWNSLKKLRNLPNDTKIYCGHEYTLNNAKFLESVIPNDSINNKIEKLKQLELDKMPSIPSTIKEEKELNLFFQSDSNNLKQKLDMKEKTDEETFAYLRNLKDNF
jgi:hydroxyacylglutathione hydrolase